MNFMSCCLEGNTVTFQFGSKKKLPVAAGSSCCIPTTLFCVFFPLHFDEMQYSQKVTRGNEISVYKVV